MPTNDFDSSVMPSATAARMKERKMLGGVPLYAIATLLLAACILAAVSVGVTGR